MHFLIRTLYINRPWLKPNSTYSIFTTLALDFSSLFLANSNQNVTLWFFCLYLLKQLLSCWFFIVLSNFFFFNWRIRETLTHQFTHLAHLWTVRWKRIKSMKTHKIKTGGQSYAYGCILIKIILSKLNRIQYFFLFFLTYFQYIVIFF